MLIWDEALAEYRLSDDHPLNPVRLLLTVDLMNEYGLLVPGLLAPPRLATVDELLLIHSSGYIEAVQEASDWGTGLSLTSGLGTADNPIFPGMHHAAALICGASIVALQNVVFGERKKAFSVAGGLHHAHRGRAAGFCIYNDPAVAIASVRRSRPGLRVLYIDIDAHHGDGVQESFYGTDQVMTISVHQSGISLFPGTGFPNESGYGEGTGFSANVPLPSGATDSCFLLAYDEVIAPLARLFAPDVIVAQLGVDAHHADPLTNLRMTLPCYRELCRGIIGLADELCDGKICCLGGGGYQVAGTVPRAWTWLMAELMGIQLAEKLPEAWREHERSMLGEVAVSTLGADDRVDVPAEVENELLEATRRSIEDVRTEVFPRVEKSMRNR